MDTFLSPATMFDLTDSTAASVELFPEVWRAAENLTSPDILVRRDALDRLIVLDAPR